MAKTKAMDGLQDNNGDEAEAFPPPSSCTPAHKHKPIQASCGDKERPRKS